MADEFLDCRLKADHSVTRRIPASSLPYFSDWEQIPRDEPPETGEPSEPGVSGAPAGSQTEKSSSRSRTARKTADADSKEGTG